jgi:hypothetical protein
VQQPPYYSVISLLKNQATIFDISQEEIGLADIIKLPPSNLVANSGGWVLPKEGGGAFINGRWYAEHALERIAPRTPPVMAELEARALQRASAKGLEPGTKEFGKWMKRNGPAPRGVPLSVVEAEIASPGSTNVRVILNHRGEVVTVITGGT